MAHGGKLLIDQLAAHGVARVFEVPGESFLAVLDGLQQVIAAAGIDIRQVESLIHGTTLVINALIERRGATTARTPTSATSNPRRCSITGWPASTGARPRPGP